MSAPNLNTIMALPVHIEPPEFYDPRSDPSAYPEKIIIGNGEVAITDNSLLTLNQARVMVYGALGYSEPQTATRLLLSEQAIGDHRGRAYRALGASSMEDAVELGFDAGFFTTTSSLVLPDLTRRLTDTLAVVGKGKSPAEQMGALGVKINALWKRHGDLRQALGVPHIAAAVLLDNMQKPMEVQAQETVIAPGIYYIRRFPSPKDDSLEWYSATLKFPHDGLLDDTERQLLALAAIGQTNKKISDVAGLEEPNVNRRLNKIYSKLGIPSGRGSLRKVRAITAAVEDGHMIIERYIDTLHLNEIEKLILHGYSQGNTSAQITDSLPLKFGRATGSSVRNVMAELNNRLGVPNTIAAVTMAHTSGNLGMRRPIRGTYAA